MVPSSSARHSSGNGSGGLAVFLATVVWIVSLCLMPWMVPPRFEAQLRVSPRVGFWAMAAITLVLAWPLRHDPKRGSLVLGGSVLIASWYLLTLG
jgi:endonuclease/exonuclease/phosphatase (EEP) superfamily protein YafD